MNTVRPAPHRRNRLLAALPRQICRYSLRISRRCRSARASCCTRPRTRSRRSISRTAGWYRCWPSPTTAKRSRPPRSAAEGVDRRDPPASASAGRSAAPWCRCRARASRIATSQFQRALNESAAIRHVIVLIQRDAAGAGAADRGVQRATWRRSAAGALAAADPGSHRQRHHPADPGIPGAGARRPPHHASTWCVRTLHEAGLIRYRRGLIEIVDRNGLKNESCSCYRTVRRQIDQITPPGTTSPRRAFALRRLTPRTDASTSLPVVLDAHRPARPVRPVREARAHDVARRSMVCSWTVARPEFHAFGSQTDRSMGEVKKKRGMDLANSVRNTRCPMNE